LQLWLFQPAGVGDSTSSRSFLKSNRSARGVFTQTVIAKSGRKPQQSAGIFALQRPGKFRWSYEIALQAIAGQRRQQALELRPRPEPGRGQRSSARPSAPARRRCWRGRIWKYVEATAQGWRRQLRPGASIGFRRQSAGEHGNPRQLWPDHALRFTQFESNPVLPASLFRFTAPAGADVVGD
jgi:outer membrane lipoprotein carrier protein